MRKTCTTCGKRKTLDAFYRGSGKHGRRGKCIQCTREQWQTKYWENVEAARKTAAVAARNWRAANRPRARELSRDSQRRHIRNLRERIREKLGNKCATCPVVTSQLLHIEHRNDDGHADKRVFAGNKTAFYNHVLGSPARYQLMCPNCNHRKCLARKTDGRTAAARYSAKQRTEAIRLLGGVCKNCGEDDTAVLCVDHRAGDGRQSRAKCGGSVGMYKDVVRSPAKYQLLCHNCKWLKRYRCQEWRH